jgi:hypothetical protein
MAASLILPSGIVVDRHDRNYKFYYKPIINNSSKTSTLKQRKYKCYLHVAIFSQTHIQIQDFDCKVRGGGKGDGRFLFCKALNYLKTELALADDTVISLTAISLNARDGQNKLIDYYARTYGFVVIKEKQVMDTYRTDMTTTIKTALEKCMVVVRPSKTLRQKITDLLAWGRREART